MMGRNDKPQKPLFYTFNLDEVVPQDHLLRKIDRFLDLSDLHEHLVPVTPAKRVSPTDPQARWTAAPGGPAFYAYSTNYLVDTDAGIIVDVEATPAHRTLEVQSTKTMIERLEERLELKTKKLIGDTAYGTAEFLAWMVEDKGIEPHVPVWEKAERQDGTFGRSDFHYDAVNDEYTCPAGKQLKKYWTRGWQSRSRIDQGSTLRYHALKKDCEGCGLKEQCCPNTDRRKVTRSVHETARDVARAVAKTPAYRQTRRQRKQVEMLFAHMKRVLKMDRLRLRGIKGAQDEFLLTATAQNLRRMAKYLGTGPPGIPKMA